MPDESKTTRLRKVDLADQYWRIGIKSVAAAVRRQKQKNNADRFSKSQERKGTDLKRSSVDLRVQYHVAKSKEPGRQGRILALV